jgi:putative transposase
MLQDRLGISERRACRYVGQPRSTQRREPIVAQDDAALRTELRAFSRQRPRWGYRQAHQHLLDQGWSLNRKRVQRLWREEGLRVPAKRRKRQRRGESTVPGDRLRAERPNQVWAFDFQFDVTDDGRMVKLLYVVDEFTREALAMEAERSIDADRVVNVLDRVVRERGTHPEFVRCDNGPEMTSAALQDWCRFSRTGAAFIEPGSPWENPFVESFNSRVRDELLAVEMFSCLVEAKVMVEDFRQDYNRCRPHRAHGMMTPTAFKTGWETAHQATRASAELRSPYGLSGSRDGCPPRLPQNRACAVHTRLLGTAGCEPRRRPLSATLRYPHSIANCSWVEATISSCQARCSSTSESRPRSVKYRGRSALSTCGMWLSAHRDLRP